MEKTLELPKPLDFTEQVKTAMKEWIICNYYPGFEPRTLEDNNKVKKFEEYLESKLKENRKIIAHTIKIIRDPEEVEDKIFSIYMGLDKDDDQNLNLKFVEYHDILFTYLNWKDDKGNWFYLRYSPPGSFSFNLEKLYHETENYYNKKE